MQVLKFDWNPITGIDIVGNFKLHFYSLMWVVAFVIGWYIMKRIFTKEKVSLDYLDPLFIYTVLATMLGARLGHVLFYQSELIGKITDSNLGVRFIQDYYYKSQITQLTGIKDVKKAYAAVTENPQFAELLEKVPYRHPAQLYESFSYIFVFLILWYFYSKTDKKNQSGFLFGLFLILLWTIRFFVEFTKEPQGEEYINWFGLNTGQWLSIPFVLLGLYFMFVYKPKSAVK